MSNFYIVSNKNGQPCIETTTNLNDLLDVLGTKSSSNLAGHTLRKMKKTDFSSEQKDAVTKAVNEIKQHYTDRWNKVNKFIQFFIKFFALFSKNVYTPARIDELANKIFKKLAQGQGTPKEQFSKANIEQKQEGHGSLDLPAEAGGESKLASQKEIAAPSEQGGAALEEFFDEVSAGKEDPEASKSDGEEHFLSESKSENGSFSHQLEADALSKKKETKDNDESAWDFPFKDCAVSEIFTDEEDGAPPAEYHPGDASNAKGAIQAQTADDEEIQEEMGPFAPQVSQYSGHSEEMAEDAYSQPSKKAKVATEASEMLPSPVGVEDEEELDELKFEEEGSESAASDAEDHPMFEPFPDEGFLPEQKTTQVNFEESKAQENLPEIVLVKSSDAMSVESLPLVSPVPQEGSLPVEEQLLLNPEFQELQKLSVDVNQALVSVYKQYPMVETVLNSAIVEIAKDVQFVVHNCLMQAAKEGGKLSVDALFTLLSTRLEATVGEKSAKPVASLILNKLVFNEALGALNPANQFNPLDIAIGKLSPFVLIKLLDLPLKIFLLDGICRQMVEGEVKKRSEQMDQFFQGIFEKIDLQKYFGEKEVGLAAQTLIEVGMKASYHHLKKKASVKLQEMLGSSFQLALGKLKELAKDNGYEDYFSLSQKIFGTLYQGTGFAQSTLGKLAENFLLTPLSYVGKAAQIADQPFQMTKNAAMEIAWSAGKSAVGKAAELVNQNQESLASQIILCCYRGILNFPKEIAGGVVQYKVEDQVKKISKGIRREMALALLPSIEGEAVPLNPYSNSTESQRPKSRSRQRKEN